MTKPITLADFTPEELRQAEIASLQSGTVSVIRCDCPGDPHWTGASKQDVAGLYVISHATQFDESALEQMIFLAGNHGLILRTLIPVS